MKFNCIGEGMRAPDWGRDASLTGMEEFSPCPGDEVGDTAVSMTLGDFRCRTSGSTFEVEVCLLGGGDMDLSLVD